MDDTFIIEEIIDLNVFLDKGSNFHLSIKFTPKTEVNSKCYFLEVQLKRIPDGSL